MLGQKLVFTKMESKESLPFYLVYSFDITTEEAVNQTYQLASKDTVKEVALLLRGIILRAFKESKDLPWPPAASDLAIRDGVIPDTLQRFLTFVACGQPTASSDHSERIIFSIGQDLCRAVTNAEWKLPKHILLCLTLRHMFRSKQLLTILNRLGQCESYSFAVELETAIATVLEQKSSLLNANIVKGPGNIVFHSEWDNFDKLLTGIHGRPSVHTAAGIMLQEATGSHSTAEDSTQPSIPKTRKRSLHLDSPAPLPPFYITNKKGPSMDPHNIQQPQANETSFQEALKIYIAWILCRVASGNGAQQVPAFGGFVSATGYPPIARTTIEYYPTIQQPITEYNVVRELLIRSKKASEEVGQQYTIITFDLGVVMKAMPIIWKNPEEYSKHVILIGPFHTVMNYLNMIGHKMAGSGYA